MRTIIRFSLILILSMVITTPGHSFGRFAFIKKLSASWYFGNVGEFTYSGSQFTVSNSPNTATIVPLDFTVDTQGEFDAAGSTHVGTQYASSKLSLTGSSAQAEHGSGWTPNWSNVVLYYKMNESSWTGSANDVTDSSGLSHPGTSFNSPNTTALDFKLGGRSGLFDGVNDYIKTADSTDYSAPATRPTVSVWVKPKNISKIMVVFEKGSELYKIRALADNTWEFKVRVDGNVSVTAIGGVVTTEWTHLVLVYDGTNLLGYINGVLAVSSPASGNIYPNPWEIFVGCEGNVSSGCNGNYFDGYMDDFIIFKTAISAADVRTIYTRQVAKYAGMYISPVLDAASSRDWAGIRWKTNLPYGKELPGDSSGDGTPDGESSSSYPSISPSGEDLATDLIGLWHLNESLHDGTSATAKDSSGNGNHAQLSMGSGNSISGITAVFNKGANIATGSGFLYATPPNVFTSKVTNSFWLRSTATTDYCLFVGKNPGSQGFKMYRNPNNTVTFQINSSGSTGSASSTTAVFDGKLHHIVGVADSGSMKLYVDGKQEGTASFTLGAGFGNTDIYNFNYNCQPMILDEVALWNRGLSAAEVLQLYRRGANRVSFLIRSCDDSACSGESWQSPRNGLGPSFSETKNYSGIDSSGEGTGAINLFFPWMDFAKFSAGGLAVAPNRYFQFLIDMQTEDAGSACSSATCMPDVVSVSPTPAFAIGTAVGRAYAGALKKFRVTLSGDCGTVGDVRFQVSSDNGVTYKYWNSNTSAWTTVSSSSSDYAQAATLTLTNSNIGTLGSNGTFQFKALVPSQYSTTCVLKAPYIR